VRPAVAAQQGLADPRPRFLRGSLAQAVRRNAERDELVRARTAAAGDAIVLEPVAGQESHMIVSAAQADALVFVPRGPGELPAGHEVGFLSLA
jgi:molybdopterin biosynthesis enzyme